MNEPTASNLQEYTAPEITDLGSFIDPNRVGQSLSDIRCVDV